MTKEQRKERDTALAKELAELKEQLAPLKKREADLKGYFDTLTGKTTQTFGDWILEYRTRKGKTFNKDRFEKDHPDINLDDYEETTNIKSLYVVPTPKEIVPRASM